MSPSYFSLCILFSLGTFLALGTAFCYCSVLILTRSTITSQLRYEFQTLSYDFRFAAMDTSSTPGAQPTRLNVGNLSTDPLQQEIGRAHV